jgi:hypothetical protein
MGKVKPINLKCIKFSKEFWIEHKKSHAIAWLFLYKRCNYFVKVAVQLSVVDGVPYVAE